MTHKPGAQVPQTAIYWCSICKLPAKFEAGQIFPMCKNKCGRGTWEFVRTVEAAGPKG